MTDKMAISVQTSEMLHKNNNIFVFVLMKCFDSYWLVIKSDPQTTEGVLLQKVYFLSKLLSALFMTKQRALRKNSISIGSQ